MHRQNGGNNTRIYRTPPGLAVLIAYLNNEIGNANEFWRTYRIYKDAFDRNFVTLIKSLETLQQLLERLTGEKLRQAIIRCLADLGIMRRIFFSYVFSVHPGRYIQNFRIVEDSKKALRIYGGYPYQNDELPTSFGMESQSTIGNPTQVFFTVPVSQQSVSGQQVVYAQQQPQLWGQPQTFQGFFVVPAPMPPDQQLVLGQSIVYVRQPPSSSGANFSQPGQQRQSWGQPQTFFLPPNQAAANPVPSSSPLIAILPPSNGM